MRHRTGASSAGEIPTFVYPFAFAPVDDLLRAALISSADPSSQRTGSVPVISASCFARFHDGRLRVAIRFDRKAAETPAALAISICFIMTTIFTNRKRFVNNNLNHIGIFFQVTPLSQ